MPHDVFISYSSLNKATADAICAGLEYKGLRCWIAPRDIPPGSNYGAQIDSAIEGASAMVLVFSEGANRSHYVMREAEAALAYGKLIIPFRLEDIPISRDLRFYLRSAHWLDAVSPPLAKHIASLGKGILDHLGPTASFGADARKASLQPPVEPDIPLEVVVASLEDMLPPPGPDVTLELPPENPRSAVLNLQTANRKPFLVSAACVAVLLGFLFIWVLSHSGERKPKTASLNKPAETLIERGKPSPEKLIVPQPPSEPSSIPTSSYSPDSPFNQTSNVKSTAAEIVHGQLATTNTFSNARKEAIRRNDEAAQQKLEALELPGTSITKFDPNELFNVSSILVGSPGRVVINGTVYDEGQSISFKLHDKTLSLPIVKIQEDGVVMKLGSQQFLVRKDPQE